MSIDSGASLALHTRGLALLRAGREHEAATCLRQAVSLAPESAHAHYHLAIAYRLRGELAEARAELRAAVIEIKRTASRLSRSLDTVLVPGEADTVLPELIGALRGLR